MESTRKLHIPAALAAAALLVAGLASCSGSDDPATPSLPEGVPTKVESPTCIDDAADADLVRTEIMLFTDLAAKLTNLRWQMYYNLTGGFDAQKGYVGTYNAADWDRYLEVCAELYKYAEEYGLVIDALMEQGILHVSDGTRAIPSATPIVSSLKKIDASLATGQKKIMDVMRRPGMATAEQWKAAFDALPSELRYGATNWQQWRTNVYNNDFGGGVFNNLHGSRTYMYLCNENSSSASRFADEAQEQNGGGVPGYTHAYQVGHVAVEEGRNIRTTILKAQFPMFGNFMDGVDIGMASVSMVNAVSKGDDAAATDAMLTICNVTAGQVGNFGNSPYLLTEGINAGYDIFNQTMKSDLNSAYYTYANHPGSDIGLVSGSDVGSDGSPAGIYVVDSPSGGTNVVFADNAGNAVIPITDSGDATVTAVDNNGNTGQTTVSTRPGQTTKVTVSTTPGGDELPADGYLRLSRDSVFLGPEFDPVEIGYETNYHYLAFKASDKWLGAVLLEGKRGRMGVFATDNDTGQPRRGNIIVLATDKAGNVQKYAVLGVAQEAGEGGITVSPSEIKFAYNAYDKDVSATLTGWTYLGAYVAKDADKTWITLTPDQGFKSVNVAVARNNTGQKREALCYAYGTDSADRQYHEDQLQKAPFWVVQEAEGTLELSSQALVFGAAGGSASQKVTLSGYSRLGSVIDNDGQGWLSVTPHGNTLTVDIVCSRNTTGLERTGHYYVFATNFDNPLVGDCKMVRVTVAQSAEDSGTDPGTGGTSTIRVTKFGGVQLQGTFKTQEVWTGYGTTTTQPVKGSSFGFTSTSASCELKGTTLHVTATSNNTRENVSFDVTNFTGTCSGSKIMNFRYTNDKSYGSYSGQVVVGLSNIPITTPFAASTASANATLTYSGTVGGGMTVTTYSDTYGDGSSNTEYRYVSDASNNATVRFSFYYTLSGSSAPRRATFSTSATDSPELPVVEMPWSPYERVEGATIVISKKTYVT